MISKAKEILAAEENLKWKKRAYSYLAKRLKDNEALPTISMKKLNEKQKIIQEQANLIKDKEKDSTKLLGAAENLHETLLTRAMNFRNLLSIDSRLNRIVSSTYISPPNPERGYITKFDIILEEVFTNSIE